MLFAGLAITIAAPGVMAQVVHQDWEALGSRGDCCAVTLPLLSDGAVNRAGQAYVSVTHNRSEGLRDAVSFVSGLGDVSDADVIASVRGESGERFFELLPFGSAAFARDGYPGRSPVAPMLPGRVLLGPG